MQPVSSPWAALMEELLCFSSFAVCGSFSMSASLWGQVTEDHPLAGAE